MKRILQSQRFQRMPFEYIAGACYLIGNLTLTFKGTMFNDAPLTPSIDKIIQLDPIALQALTGLTFILISIVIFGTKKYPNIGIKAVATLNCCAYITLLLSGYNREEFLIHALGILPCFFAAILLFQGNKINNKKTIFGKYPVAIAGLVFTSSIPFIIYSALANQDYSMVFVGCIWIIANASFAMTDKNLRIKLFNSN